MNEMVERVARALAHFDFPEDPWEQQTRYTHATYRQRANVAIAAMREPTEGMTRAAYMACGCDEAYRLTKPSDHWRIMIDEALK